MSHLGNIDRIALAECRRNIREECLGLPGRAHIFTEEREKGKEEFVRERRKGGSILAWRRACVCLGVFFFPFLETSIWKARDAKNRKGCLKIKHKGEEADSDSLVQ